MTNEQELKKLKNAELKEMCKELGLLVSGNKKALVDRILLEGNRLKDWKEWKELEEDMIAKIYSTDANYIITQKRSFDNSSVTIKKYQVTPCGDLINPEVYSRLNSKEEKRIVKCLTTPPTGYYSGEMSGYYSEEDYWNCGDEWFGPGPAALRD